jgi:hypothetical protein
MARVGRSDTFIDTADVEPTSDNDDALVAAINRQRQENLGIANILRAALAVVCPSGLLRDIPECAAQCRAVRRGRGRVPRTSSGEILVGATTRSCGLRFGLGLDDRLGLGRRYGPRPHADCVWGPKTLSGAALL